MKTTKHGRITKWEIWDSVNCKLTIFVGLCRSYTVTIFRFESPIIQKDEASARRNLSFLGKLEYGKEFARFAGQCVSDKL